MKLKGTTVESFKTFIKENFPAFYDEWLEQLPAESRNIFSDDILSGEWYPMYETAIIGTRLIADMFFDGKREEAYYEIGVFSGKKYLTDGLYADLLKGVDKKTAASYFSQFYYMFFSDGRLETIEKEHSIVFEYHDQPEYCIENLPRVAGYLQVIFQQIKTPPHKVDWPHRKGENGKFVGINTAYFD
jgi:hypothetical protein